MNASTLFAAFVGLALNIVMSWGEWQKLTGVRQSLASYVREDVPGFVTSVLLSVASYIMLPELGGIDWLRETLGFTPSMTPMSALAASFIAGTLGYQIRTLLFSRFSRKG